MSVTPDQDLPLADRDRAWDGAAAEKRVRRWADAEDAPNGTYRDRARLVRRREEGQFHRQQLLIADVIDGRLVAVPRRVMAAAAVMQGSRDGADLTLR